MTEKQKEIYRIILTYSQGHHELGRYDMLAVPGEKGKPKIEIKDLEDLVAIGSPMLVEKHHPIPFEVRVLQKLPPSGNAYIILSDSGPDQFIQYYHFDVSKYFLAQSNSNLEKLNRQLSNIVNETQVRS